MLSIKCREKLCLQGCISELDDSLGGSPFRILSGCKFDLGGNAVEITTARARQLPLNDGVLLCQLKGTQVPVGACN